MHRDPLHSKNMNIIMSSEVNGVATGAEPAAEADFVALGFFSGQGVEADPRVFSLIKAAEGDDLAVKGTLESGQKVALPPNSALAFDQPTVPQVAPFNGPPGLAHVNGKCDEPISWRNVGVVTTHRPRLPSGGVHMESIDPTGMARLSGVR